ncbi:hypothetical protein ES708_11137 [subsurface metagenome]
MPEATNIEFDYKEIAEALIRYTDIHEGLWGIAIKFGLQGANIGTGSGSDLMPAAIVPVLKLGLQRFDEPSNLTVDASEINPGE